MDSVSRSFRIWAFYPHHLIRRVFRLTFVTRNVIFTLLCAGVLIGAAALDDSFYLDGPSVGLFEHPTIWAFLLFQLVVPISLKRTIYRFLSNPKDVSRVFKSEQNTMFEIVDHTKKIIFKRSAFSMTAWASCYLFGIASFSWNSFQNQLPLELVGYDFWDSANFSFGYWTTRFYKFYIFVLLLPQVFMTLLAINVSVIDRMMDLSEKDDIKLLPYHPDKVGGFSFFPKLLTGSVFPILIILVLANLGAYFVHASVDTTPVIGSFAITIMVLSFYFVPIFFLHKTIKSMKEDYLLRISEIQQLRIDQYLSETDAAVDIDAEDASNEFGYYQKLKKSVESVSTFPHLVFYLWIAGLANTPILLQLASTAVGVVKQLSKSGVS